jgi:hypothetical protein
MVNVFATASLARMIKESKALPQNQVLGFLRQLKNRSTTNRVATYANYAVCLKDSWNFREVEAMLVDRKRRVGAQEAQNCDAEGDPTSARHECRLTVELSGAHAVV